MNAGILLSAEDPNLMLVVATSTFLVGLVTLFVYLYYTNDEAKGGSYRAGALAAKSLQQAREELDLPCHRINHSWFEFKVSV